MRLTAPAYYPLFRCIADRCRHTCCAGWRVEIDEETAAVYQQMKGTLGEMIRSRMTRNEEGTFCFVMDDAARCPMLTENGLCNIILQQGEAALCQICTDHPRFRNWFADREELGLGLCCE